MSARSAWPAPRRLPWLLLLSAVVLLLDQLSKRWIAQHIPLGGAIPIVDHIFRLTHWTNQGAAFSIFADSSSPHLVRWGLTGFTLAAALGVLMALLRLGDRVSMTTLALALILGGALGNLHDRIVYGSVIDFVEIHIFTYHWPDFNLADSAIVVGAVLLFVDSLRQQHSANP